MAKLKRVKHIVLQMRIKGVWHDVEVYKTHSKKEAYHDLCLDTKYPKRLIERIDFVEIF